MEYKVPALMDEYKAARKLKNDAELAEDLNISRACVSRWRKELSHPEPVALWKFAEVLGLNPADLICAMEAERAKNMDNAYIWNQVRRMYIMSKIAAQLRLQKLLHKRY